LSDSSCSRFEIVVRQVSGVAFLTAELSENARGMIA